MSAPETRPAPARRPGPARLAGAVCALESVLLLGAVVFYAVEVVRGRSDSVSSALGSAALILIAAVGMALLARGWFTGAPWPRTPTLVWHLVFVPVCISLVTSGQPLYALALAALVLAGGGAALVAVDEDEALEDSDLPNPDGREGPDREG